MTAYRTKVLGLGMLPNGLVLGYASADSVHARDLSQCRVIIFKLPDDPQQARTWHELIGSRADICTLDKGTDNEAH